MKLRKNGMYSPKAYGVLAGILLVGTLIGTVIYMSADASLTDRLGSLQAGFVGVRQELRFSRVLLGTLSSSTLFLAVVFLSGLCAVGQPVALCALLVRGMGFGVVLSRLYSAFAVRGVLWSLALVLPNAVVSGTVLVLAVREAVSLSNVYVCFSLSDRQENGLKETVRIYCAKFLVLEAVLALSAGVDCIVTYVMKGFVLDIV